MIWIEIVTIGAEILSGRTRDTNFTFLARALADEGLGCRWHTTVPDEREPLVEALTNALARADVVVTTGGLGSTPDDITRKVLATVLKRQLVLREDILRAIEERYALLKRPAPPNLQAQALIPLGADLIENTLGLAPGLRMRTQEGRLLYALPGVPHEMERMAARFVLPEIVALLPESRRRARVLRTIGISEVALAELLKGHVPAEVDVAFLPHLGTVDLRFTAEGSAREIEALLDRVVRPVREQLGAAVYAEGSEEIEEVVGRELIARGYKIGVAESLTGGGLGRRIVRVPGSSRYFLGDVVAYDNLVKVLLLGVPDHWIREHGAVSEEVAGAMARGVREKLGADVGVSTTGIAGPAGGSPEKPVGLVYVGVDWPGGHAVVRRQMAGEREQVIGRTVLVALDIVRRAITGLPVDHGRPVADQGPAR